MVLNFFFSQPELPLVSLSFSTKINDPVLASIEEKVRDVIKLNMTGSVQIVEFLERPGGIVVRWDEVYSMAHIILNDYLLL